LGVGVSASLGAQARRARGRRNKSFFMGHLEARRP
jgi:hypothetical protein